MTETLPPTMIAHLGALGQALMALAQQHRNVSLATLEQAVLAVVRQVSPGLLTDVLQLSTTSLRPPMAQWRQPCPQCGKRAQAHEWRRRTVLTVCGPVTWERPWIHCRHCHQGFSPADEVLGIAPRRRVSAGLAAWVVELGAETSFRDGAGLLERLTGLKVSAETLRQHTEAVGTAVEAALQTAMAEVVRTRESAAALDPAPGTLIIETDGVMVRYLHGWHEVKLGLVAGQVDGKLRVPSYVAARASAEQFGPRLLAEAARRGALEVVAWEGAVIGRGLAVLPKVVVLGDGAVWIWNLAAEHFGERIEIVDYYHATEHIWVLAKAFYGEGTAKTKRWGERQCRRLLARGAGPLLRALRASKRCSPEVTPVLRREHAYLRTNAARMDYPTFRQQGLPIGSGAIESEAKRLVQQRMKRPGARWSDVGAQAVLNVRSRLFSHLPLAC
jgi:hypothetical protein